MSLPSRVIALAALANCSEPSSSRSTVRRLVAKGLPAGSMRLAVSVAPPVPAMMVSPTLVEPIRSTSRTMPVAPRSIGLAEAHEPMTVALSRVPGWGASPGQALKAPLPPDQLAAVVHTRDPVGPTKSKVSCAPATNGQSSSTAIVTQRIGWPSIDR
jgi:hypothetical protein